MRGSVAAGFRQKSAAPGTGDASFSYSIDNRRFVKIGDVLHIRFSLRKFPGDKFYMIMPRSPWAVMSTSTGSSLNEAIGKELMYQ